MTRRRIQRDHGVLVKVSAAERERWHRAALGIEQSLAELIREAVRRRVEQLEAWGWSPPPDRHGEEQGKAS